MSYYNFFEIENQIAVIKDKLEAYFRILQVSAKKEMIQKLETQSMAPDFWNDPVTAQKVSKQMNDLKLEQEKFAKLFSDVENLEAIIELLKEAEDSALKQELEGNLSDLEARVAELETLTLLGEEGDRNNAILSIHPGAGGTESQDWAQMLFRMYQRWCEQKNFSYHLFDYNAGDEAGIKSVTMEITGEYAYGLLKSEIGIHRLVRISPFDSNSRRHTSFASIFVYPEVDEEIEIEINPKDLRIDTFRSSGAGGQHVNTTDSAVRITHIPTNIIVSCQSDRSQIMNRENAMKILRARLYQHQLELQMEQKRELEKTKKDIGWGNQIRSYVLHPYNLVKDHRTKEETGNTSAVLDGDINRFIEAYLKWFHADKYEALVESDGGDE